MTLDVLGSGRAPSRSRRARAAVLLALLLAAAAGGWYLDHRTRAHEYDALAGCRDQAARAFSARMDDIAAVADYVRPSLGFASDTSAASLYRMVAERAAGPDDGIERARRRCAAVDVARWHAAQQAAQDAQLASIDAELGLLAAIAADGQVFFRDGSAVTGRQRAAVAALAAADPAG